MTREAFNVGKKGTGDLFEQIPYNVVGYHVRTTASSGAGTSEAGYVRVDNIPMRNGYSYMVMCPVVNINPTVASSAAPTTTFATIRVNASGTATTASLQVALMRMQQEQTAQTDVAPMFGSYEATADGVLSVLISCARVGGSGTVGIFGSAGNPFYIYVYEMGKSVPDSGTDL